MFSSSKKLHAGLSGCLGFIKIGEDFTATAPAVPQVKPALSGRAPWSELSEESQAWRCCAGVSLNQLILTSQRCPGVGAFQGPAGFTALLLPALRWLLPPSLLQPGSSLE